MSTQTNNSTFSQSMNGLTQINADDINTTSVTADTITASYAIITPNSTTITASNDIVGTASNQTITGIKTFTNNTNVHNLIFPDGTSMNTASNSSSTDPTFHSVTSQTNVTTPQVTFSDGTYFTTASAPQPTDPTYHSVTSQTNVTTPKVTFSDGTYFTTASASLPSDINCVNVNASNDVKATNYVKGGNLWTEGELVNTNPTATNVVGFPYTPNIYSFQYITGTPEIYDFVQPTQSNMPTGIESNFYLVSFNIAGSLTFNSNNMSNTSMLYQTVDGYCPKNNEIWGYDFTSGLISLGSGVIMSGCSTPILPFVNNYTSYLNSYYVTTPLTNFNLSGSVTNSGYFKNATTLVSNDSFINGRYLTASTNIEPPTRVVSSSGKLITIQSKNTITPSVSSGSISGTIISATQISYITNTSVVGDFLGGGQADGITVSAIDTVNHLITVANGSLSGLPVSRTTIKGYVSANNTIQTYDATNAVVGDYVVGPGVTYPNNYVISKTSTAVTLQQTTATIASPVNSFTGYIDTNRIITNGTLSANLNFFTNAGLPVPTRATNQTGVYVNITSPSAITNTTKNNFYAVSFGGNKLAYVSTVATAGNFISSSNGLYDVADGTIISSIDTTASNQIITLSNTVPTNTAQTTVKGYVVANNKISLVDNTYALSGRYFFDSDGLNGIPYGNNYYVSSSGTGVVLNTSNLTPTTAGGTFYGYIKTGGTTSAVMVTNNSFGTGTTTEFVSGSFAGTGYFASLQTGVIRNLSCAGTNTATATASTTFQGFVWDTFNISYISAPSSGLGAFYLGTGIPEGTDQVSSNNTTDQILPVKTGLTIQSTPDYTKIGYALSTNTIQLYDTTSIVVNQFIRSTYTTQNKPYITAVNTTSKVLTIGGTVSTQTAIFSPIGYILNATTLILSNTSANSTAISNATFASGTGLGQPTQITAYNSTTNQYTIQSPNTITPTVAVFTGYGVIISTVGYNKLITNNTVVRTNVSIECNPLLDYGSIGNGTSIIDILYNTQSNSSTYSIIAGAFYGGFFIVSPSTSVALGTLLTSTTPSNPYTSCIFSGALQTTQGSGGKYATTSVALTNSTPRLSADRQWIVSSSTEIAYQLGATGTPAINDLLYASDNTYVSGSVITAISNSTYRILQCSGRTFTVPTAVETRTTVGTGTNQNRINLSALTTAVQVGMFVKIASLSSSILGAKITALSAGPVFWVDVDTLVSYSAGTSVSFYNGNTASSFNVLQPQSCGTYASTTLKLYNPITVNVYANQNFNFYNPITITNWAPTSFSKYPSQTISITAPGAYSSIVPSTFNEITSSTYSFYDQSSIPTFTPVSIKQWANQQVNFYNPQTINLYRDNRITIPKTTDTMALCDYAQTLNNKTLTNPIINGATLNGNTNSIVLNTGVTPISATNGSGVNESFLWARNSTDNGTYLNYGAGGMNIRNNSSTTTLSMFNNNFITGSKVFTGVINNCLTSPIASGSSAGTASYYYLPYSSTQRVLIQMYHAYDTASTTWTFPIAYDAGTTPWFFAQRWMNGNQGALGIQSLTNTSVYVDTVLGYADKSDFHYIVIGLKTG